MPSEPSNIEIRATAANTERIENKGPLLELGQWYWVTDWKKWDKNDSHAWGATREEYEVFLRKKQSREEAAKNKKPKSINKSRRRSSFKHEIVEEYKWLGCLMNIGSNFVELESPCGEEVRIHMDEFDERLLLESDPRKHIGNKVAHYQQVARDTLEEIRALTARLGIVERQGIEHSPDTATRALAAASGQKEIKAYESSLVKAKEKDLPALFENVESATKEMTIWMKAETLPMQAQVGDLNSVIKVVDDRIFDMSLYAGLVEAITEIRGGEPAAYDEPVRLFQRRLYMDEECLANYRVGGMEFKNVKAFGRWLCRPKNLNRVFPFPRCMVSFKVRRNDKLRWGDGTYAKRLINFNLKQDDEVTFWYIRNGDRMYCLETKLEFGSMIFPDEAEFNISAPQMVRIDWRDKVKGIISVHQYKDMIERRRIEEKERKRKRAEWKKANPKKGFWNPHNSYRSFDDGDSWHPFTPDSIYYDEAKAEIESRVRYYNRIALILQGLFDRSEILNPHPKAKLWEADNFSQMVELVYDGGMVLHAGDKPDFGAYWRRCNESLGEGSVTVGQDDYWQMLEAEKYSAQAQRSFYGERSEYRPKRYSPYGNKGPGYTARVAKWSKRKRQATYRWGRERQGRRRDYWVRTEEGEFIQSRVAVPAEKLFNVSAYKAGDYKQFFDDPRTRAEYVQWAGYLLASEEYLAGNEKVQEPEDVVAGHIKKQEDIINGR